MPMHDWTRVTPGTYHNFHFLWTSNLTNRLNAGLLPTGYFAMAEQIVGRPEPDVVTLQTGAKRKHGAPPEGAVAVAAARPKTTFVLPLPIDRYARKTNRI